jgi:chemotaxis protein methyltransferase CheR
MRLASTGAAKYSIQSAELLLGDDEFEFLRAVVERNAGIVLGPNKRQLVQGRLARRLRELGLASFAQYCDVVRDSGPEELVALINAITTNVTSFFRENHHLEALGKYMLPEAVQRNASSRRLRIWSAGCSSGEEPYSIAMVCAETLAASSLRDLKILATDIDTDVVSAASRGIFSADKLSGLPLSRLHRWFRRGAGSNEGFVKAHDDLVSMISFRTLNLMHEWPVRGPFDVIFCRNVMIYFDANTRDQLVRRFASVLSDGGYLCLGHSESIHAPSSAFKLVGRTIYQKVAAHAQASV